MASIKEILEFESSRNETEMQRSIHLFQEGSFYRAYEWSAWLVCRYIHEFKVTHRRLKGIEQSVVLIGFPLTSLSKWFGDNIERHDVSDKHIIFNVSSTNLFPDNHCVGSSPSKIEGVRGSMMASRKMRLSESKLSLLNALRV